MTQFAFVPHTADIAIRLRGAEFADLLRAGALGIAAAATDQETLAPRRAPGVAPRRIEAEGAPDEEGLLVTFLNELLFQGETNGEVYTDLEVQAYSLAEGVRAEAYPDPTLTPTRSIKAATYYDLHITRGPDGLEATVVFDV